MASLTFLGNPVKTNAQFPAVGTEAPEFTLTRSHDNSPFKSTDLLGHGKLTVISVFPSVDTPVCSKQTKEFVTSKFIKEHGVQLMNISMDLPFAQNRHSESCGFTDPTTMYSDHIKAEFGTKYGMLLPDMRLLARGVFVVDKAGKIAYVQVPTEISHEVDFAALYAKLEELEKQ
ncbi:Peroxiredoxin [Monocercomonoides exilis]|uniref:Peroxiredoxin n=1 Tax=Monocercomonoides exilis TaxID=2049356 RepID=UPI00355AB288|nr:Peroxiredoxin [Monocercomonoides exilis]|eukprot:MONOS_740.1-p1 / transcript=MONOS_740.1 / gene=MONOS_740 / organism=Monocercomonoides_exilis_PA203 / gene_product=Peroxiredoxin / transcript_product=Peroxiredoxin / location=Mono_scaffold00012:173188-173709(-) / protein_length=174 / sequence_SO=supercontig / SO=protein_coding / is_pseudo=false